MDIAGDRPPRYGNTETGRSLLPGCMETHGIIKKSAAVPENEIQRALRNKRNFEQDPGTHTQELVSE